MTWKRLPRLSKRYWLTKKEITATGVGNFMSLENFSIIESTLREGEQFAGAFFSPEQKVKIATVLDEFGVEMLELSSPLASTQSEADVRMIVGLKLKAKILTH